jgi:hypothetical protein
MPGRDVVDESVSALDLSAAPFERTPMKASGGGSWQGSP